MIVACTIKVIGMIVAVILGVRIGNKMKIGIFPVGLLFGLSALVDLSYFRDEIYFMFTSKQHDLWWVKFLNCDWAWSLIVVVFVVILALWADNKATAEADIRQMARRMSDDLS